MKKFGLAYGASGDSIQLAAFSYSSLVINFTSIPVVNTEPLESEVVRIIATQDCFIKLGSGSWVEYSSHATNNDVGDNIFEVQEDIDASTPSSGIIKLWDFTDGSEVSHTYSSWLGKIFSGISPVLTKDYDGDDKAYPFVGIIASSSDLLLKANQPEYFTLRGNKYLSVVRSTNDGILYVETMV
jgi:3D (Asp-Asp-Asp) domain-containing protein